jgi:hypothetical protein
LAAAFFALRDVRCSAMCSPDIGLRVLVSPHFSYYFLLRLTPTVFFGPLRVRAFVLVRWPRTGSPRRWRTPR